MFAFLPTLGFGEMMLLVVIGLLLYGRNLPQAGRTMGQFVAQLKRGFQDFKDQMDRDESLREVRKTIADTTREMRNLTAVPRAIANPVEGVRDLARNVIDDATADVPEEKPDEPPPPSANGAPPGTEARPDEPAPEKPPERPPENAP